MKYFLLLPIFFFFVLGIHAQSTCEPDEFYADSLGGVYPRPVSEDFPDAGIDVPACPGQEYFFSLTIVVPDTIQLGPLPIAVSRVRLRTDNPVRGLPPGLSFVCNPSSCDMPSRTLGCIALVGTVSPDAEPGIYPLEILVDIVTTFGLAVPTQFPNEAIAPGEYFIVVAEPGPGGDCATVSILERNANEKLLVFPNPASGQLYINMPESYKRGSIQVEWYNNLGQRLAFDTIDYLDEARWNINLPTAVSGPVMLVLRQGEQVHTAHVLVKQ